jgi:hypothetical protein
MRPLISERKAKAEAKRIHELAVAKHTKHGEVRTRKEIVAVVSEMEEGREIEAWRMASAAAIMVYWPSGPKWSAKKKAEYVEKARAATRLVHYYLHPYIEEYKAKFVASAAEWARKEKLKEERKVSK